MNYRNKKNVYLVKDLNAPSKRLNRSEVFLDIHKFVRKLNIAKYHMNKQAAPLKTAGLGNGIIHSRDNERIDAFKRAMLKELEKPDVKQKQYNLNKEERQALGGLGSTSGIIINPCDKGGGW